MQSKDNLSSYVPSLKLIINFSIAFIVINFLLVIIFGLDVETSPPWFFYANQFFLISSFFLASLACFRNWFYPRLISDRKIWLILGLGLLAQAIANIIFSYWQLELKRDPDASLADLFYIGAYLLMIISIFFAFRFRGTNLEFWQWGVVGFVSVMAIGLALATNPSEDNVYLPPENYMVKIPQEIVVSDYTQSISEISNSIQFVVDEEETENDNAPAWVIASETMVKPIIGLLNISYVIADVGMLIMSSILLVTFWGGRFSQTWLAVSMGTLFFYIADIWYAYAVNVIDVQPRGLINCFWTLSGVCFMIAAAFEYDISFNLINRQSNRQE